MPGDDLAYRCDKTVSFGPNSISFTSSYFYNTIRTYYIHPTNTYLLMTTANETSDSKTNGSWGLDTNSLDDWLENDLKQSSLFQQRNKQASKYQLSHIITQDTPLQEKSNKINKIEGDYNIESLQPSIQSDKNITPPTIPLDLTRLVKIYSLLNSVRHNEKAIKSNCDSEYNNNKYAPTAPPSPMMSVDSNKHSVKNSRKRKGNHRPPVDENIKRQRNTDAARRSRLKKAIKMESLEKKVGELKTDNDRLRVRVAVLETEVGHVTEKEKRNRQRVLELEAQLANAHKKLVNGFQKSE